MNIGRGEPVRLRDFIEIIEGLVSQSAKLKIVPTPASEPPITYASVDKARRLLGYQPHTSIREGLAQTWEWYRTEVKSGKWKVKGQRVSGGRLQEAKKVLYNS